MTPREHALRVAEQIRETIPGSVDDEAVANVAGLVEKALADSAAGGNYTAAWVGEFTETRIKRILSSAPAVLFSFDAKGNFRPTFISDNIVELLGYQPDEYLKSSDFWRRRVHPNDADRVESEFSRLFDSDDLCQEYRFLHHDGKYRWLRDEQHLIRDANDEPLEVVGSWSDVTSHKEVEHALVAAQERITSLVVSSPAVLYSFRASGNFSPTFISDNIEDIFGYAPTEYMANADFWRDAVHPDDLERVEAEFSRLLRTGYCALEYRFTHRDGSHRWVSDEQHLIRAKNGQPLEVVGSWSDITLRKKLEHEKDAVKARLQYLITASPAVIYSYEATGDYSPTFISENFTDLLGYEPREYLENPDFWQRGLHPEDVERALAAMPTLFEEGHLSQEYRFLRKDGTYCWISDDQHLMRDEAGRPIEVVGAWSDITPRKRMGEAVVKAQNRLLHVLSSSPAVIYSFEAEGRFVPTFVSENLHALFGYQPENYLKASDFWWRRIHPDDLERVEANFEFLKTAGTSVLEYRFLHADGDYRWVCDEQRLICDNKGTPIEVVGSWSDITSRKQAEENLAASEQRLRDAIEAIPEGFSLFDADDRLTICNRRYSEFLHASEDSAQTGATFEEVLRNTVQSGLIVDANSDPEGWIASRLSAHREPGGIHIQRRTDGRWIQVSETRTQAGGTAAVYTDISGIKQKEEELRVAKEEAERALGELRQTQESLIHSEKMASLGQLTAGIAHEIKNPLNFVNNFASVSGDLLQELEVIVNSNQDLSGQDEVSELFDTLSKNLHRIKEHGARADRIVKGMLAHARHAPSTASRTDLNVLVDESLNLAYHAARAEDQTFNVTLERDYDSEVGEVNVYGQEMSRVFLNLIGNGFYALSNRQRQDRDTGYRPVLVVRTRSMGDSVRVQIQDNGTGMAEEVRKKVFAPFFTTKPTGFGTGLGLSISYDIVTKQHQGRLEVSSRAGEFTEFTVTLPR